MNKDKLITIVALSCLIVVGLGVSISMSINNNKITNKPKTEQSSKTNTIKNDKGKDIEVLDYSKVSANFEIGNEKSKQIDEIEGRMIEDTVRKFISEGKWEEAENEIKPLIKKYNFNTPVGKTLQNIYFDIALVLNLPAVEHQYYAKVFSGMRDEQDLLTAVINLPENLRRGIILNEESLSPTYVESMKIDSVDKSEKEEIKNEVSKLYKDVSQISKINFKVNSIPLEAYVLHFGDGNIKLYKIIVPEGIEHNFETVKYWRDLDAEIKLNINE